MRCEILVTVLVVLLACGMVDCRPSDHVDSNLYDLVKNSSVTLSAFKHANDELKDRFLLLSYLLNTTISFKIYKIGVSLKQIGWDEDELDELHDEIFSSKTMLDESLQTQFNSTQKLSALAEEVHFDLIEDLMDLVSDYSALQNSLPAAVEVFWSTHLSITNAASKIRDTVLSAVQDESGDEVDEITRLVTRIDELLQGETLGIEVCKSTLDFQAVEMQLAINALINHVTPYDAPEDQFDTVI